VNRSKSNNQADKKGCYRNVTPMTTNMGTTKSVAEARPVFKTTSMPNINSAFGDDAVHL
jgi:hypothetical protein